MEAAMQKLAFCLLILICNSLAQIQNFPYLQNFDSSYILPPNLPNYWTSTQNRTPGINDFATSTSIPYSTPKCVIATNAKVRQSLYSPILDLSNKIVDSIIFFERRSSSFDSDVLLEASTNGGISFDLIISDTLKYPGHTNYFQRKFRLPQQLNNRPDVKFRWHILGNGTGSTATLRFDDLLFTAKSQIDIGIISVDFFPKYPILEDSIVLIVTTQNFGVNDINRFHLLLYFDKNFDSTEQESELLQQIVINKTLLPNDTNQTTLVIKASEFTTLQFIIKVNLTGDENTTNDRKVVNIKLGISKFSVVVNEIMYKPTAPEPEWIELFNASTVSINILNWKISDSRSQNKHTITSENYIFHPGNFIIITKDTLSFFEIRPNTQCKVFLVPTLPALNNDSDAVVIFDEQGSIIDSVFYRSSYGGSISGKSLERIDAWGNSLQRSNWTSSLHFSGCTPGKKNSVSKKDFDLKVSKILFEPIYPILKDSVIISIFILNIGKKSLENFSIELYQQQLTDTSTIYKLIFETVLNQSLLPDDSLCFSTSIIIDSVKKYTFLARVVYPNDEDTLNNTYTYNLYSGYQYNTVVINEIMYAPRSGEPEWVELFNNSIYHVNLKDWKLSNKNSNLKYRIVSIDFYLPPYEYIIVTKDTALFYNHHPNLVNVLEVNSLPTYLFNNSADAVVLFDNRNIQIDSMIYYSSWSEAPGRSLERIDASVSSLDSLNWSNSLDSCGSTPGRQNYVTPLEYDVKITNIEVDSSSTIHISKIRVTVKNTGRNVINNFILELYHDKNRDSIPDTEELITLKELDINLSYRDSIIIPLNWSDPGSGIKRLIAKLEQPLDLRPKDNIAYTTFKIGYPEKSIIINEIMYAPISGLCEYIEFYNRASFPIEICDWKILNLPDSETGTITEFRLKNTDITINPNEFLVLSADSSIYKHFEYLSNPEEKIKIFIFNKSSLSLNNSGDKIVVQDLVSNTIDSVCYTPKWQNPEIYDVTGRSLERINPELSSNDARNWSTCTNEKGGTPGKQNSIYAASIPTNNSISFHPNPFSPDGDGHEDFCVINYNLSSTTNMIRIRIFDSVGRLVRILANNEPSGAYGQIIWDGLNDEKRKVNMGIYIVLLEAYDVEGKCVNKVKSVVVVAGKL